jgi:flagellin
VAAGLKALIDAGSITGLTVTVTDATDPAADAATINLAASGNSVEVNLGALASAGASTTAGGLAALNDIDVTTATGATAALSSIETLLDTSISAAASFGSAQKQIEVQGEFVQTLIDSLTSGIGSLVDADMEAASAKLQAIQVQQQLGVQALSIANQSPQVLLTLFR